MSSKSFRKVEFTIEKFTYFVGDGARNIIFHISENGLRNRQRIQINGQRHHLPFI